MPKKDIRIKKRSRRFSKQTNKSLALFCRFPSKPSKKPATTVILAKLCWKMWFSSRARRRPCLLLTVWRSIPSFKRHEKKSKIHATGAQNPVLGCFRRCFIRELKNGVENFQHASFFLLFLLSVPPTRSKSFAEPFVRFSLRSTGRKKRSHIFTGSFGLGNLSFNRVWASTRKANKKRRLQTREPFAFARKPNTNVAKNSNDHDDAVDDG